MSRLVEAIEGFPAVGSGAFDGLTVAHELLNLEWRAPRRLSEKGRFGHFNL